MIVYSTVPVSVDCRAKEKMIYLVHLLGHSMYGIPVYYTEHEHAQKIESSTVCINVYVYMYF